MMSGLADEIKAVDREHSLGICLVAGAERDRLRERVRSRYGGRGSRMWETALDCASVQDSEGWRWISRFVGARECVLLFDVVEEAEMFHVPSGEALEMLLANSSGFELYVTDADADYLICFNHHDVLVCCGSARAWLEAQSQDS